MNFQICAKPAAIANLLLAAVEFNALDFHIKRIEFVPIVISIFT
jgi:hypothetical protein